mmetsp:Transcript_21131/g.49874  ORF Transcript_21131/g.49874 Transcript_21131/m.49874 type:complete len:80 (+) Transcript_21131:81-320(+)
MGKASKKKPAKATSADTTDTVSTAPVRRSKRDLDPNTPPQENPYFSVAVFMLTFAFVLLYRMSDKIYARYFGNQKGGEL